MAEVWAASVVTAITIPSTCLTSPLFNSVVTATNNPNAEGEACARITFANVVQATISKVVAVTVKVSLCYFSDDSVAVSSCVDARCFAFLEFYRVQPKKAEKEADAKSKSV